MMQTAKAPTEGSVAFVARSARAAARRLAQLSADTRNRVLLAAAAAIEENGRAILAANSLDCESAKQAVASGTMSPAMFARLQIGERGIAQMAKQVREVAALPDPLGRLLEATELDEGLVLHKETCPLGVIGIIFEARPEVVPQVASLALKSGNAVMLKGGSEAANSNEALVSVWRECLRRYPEVPEDSLSLLQTRADVLELLALDHEVDLIIPRGSRSLVEFVANNSRIPVLGHGEGICHVYVDRAANIQKAVAVVYDAKVQGPAICNAAETLLVHEEIAPQFLPLVAAKLKQAGVEIRGCPATVGLQSKEEIVPATEEDWATEYSDLILSVKVVPSLDTAIDHINQYGSRHTESIVTEDASAASQFMNEVDAAGVYQNASTRFADGYRYGFGAELGVSNSKLHARGPMGLEGLTTYKFKLYGNGHIVADYVAGTKHFKHRKLG